MTFRENVLQVIVERTGLPREWVDDCLEVPLQTFDKEGKRISGDYALNVAKLKFEYLDKMKEEDIHGRESIHNGDATDKETVHR